MASGRNPDASKNFVENLNKLAISEHTKEVEKYKEYFNDFPSDVAKGDIPR